MFGFKLLIEVVTIPEFSIPEFKLEDKPELLTIPALIPAFTVELKPEFCLNN